MDSTASETANPDSDLDAWFDQRFAEKMAEREAAKTRAMTIIATKGTLDMAYPPFILASTAASLGWEVSVFFTCYGLNLLKRHLAALLALPDMTADSREKLLAAQAR